MTDPTPNIERTDSMGLSRTQTLSHRSELQMLYVNVYISATCGLWGLRADPSGPPWT